MKRSILLAVAILAALALYILTGALGLFGGADPEPGVDVAIADSLERPLMKVRVRPMEADQISREIVAAGRTEAARTVAVKAETMGRVVEIPVERGTYVEAGTVLVKLAEDDRPLRVSQAEAYLEQARLEYEAAQRLHAKELQADSALARAYTEYRTAQQQLEALRLDLDRTLVRAPFDGIANERYVEVGDYVGVADPVYQFIEIDPLVVTGYVTENQVQYVKPGEAGEARMSTGEAIPGTIRYVSRFGDEQSRTFRVELEVANPDGRIPAGVSAEIAIETEKVWAHGISAALVSISDDGRFGVKYLGAEEDIVRFAEADLVRTEPDRLWLGGMPQTMRLITVGQGFVKEGDRVDAIIESQFLASRP